MRQAPAGLAAPTLSAMFEICPTVKRFSVATLVSMVDAYCGMFDARLATCVPMTPLTARTKPSATTTPSRTEWHLAEVYSLQEFDERCQNERQQEGQRHRHQDFLAEVQGGHDRHEQHHDLVGFG